MADLERGQRIKSRRVELHLTQPAVVDKLEELAKALPETHALHPAKAGKPPVTLRGVQTWEQGGGIAWEKAKLLAEALQTDVQAMMHGVRPATPDLSSPATPEPLEDVLNDVLRDIKDQLAEQTRVLEEIKGHARRVEGMLEQQRAIRDETDDLAESIRRAGREMLHPREDESDRQPAPERPASATKKRAAKSRTP